MYFNADEFVIEMNKIGNASPDKFDDFVSEKGGVGKLKAEDVTKILIGIPFYFNFPKIVLIRDFLLSKETAEQNAQINTRMLDYTIKIKNMTGVMLLATFANVALVIISLFLK